MGGRREFLNGRGWGRSSRIKGAAWKKDRKQEMEKGSWYQATFRGTDSILSDMQNVKWMLPEVTWTLMMRPDSDRAKKLGPGPAATMCMSEDDWSWFLLRKLGNAFACEIPLTWVVSFVCSVPKNWWTKERYESQLWSKESVVSFPLSPAFGFLSVTMWFC